MGGNHAVSEASCRRSYVYAHIVLQIYVKGRYRLLELVASAAHIRAVVSLYRDHRINVDLRPGLVYPLVSDKDYAFHESGLCSLSRLEKPLVYQKSINSLLQASPLSFPLSCCR